jgi:hypothetical protein
MPARPVPPNVDNSVATRHKSKIFSTHSFIYIHHGLPSHTNSYLNQILPKTNPEPLTFVVNCTKRNDPPRVARPKRAAKIPFPHKFQPYINCLSISIVARDWNHTSLRLWGTDRTCLDPGTGPTWRKMNTKVLHFAPRFRQVPAVMIINEYGSLDCVQANGCVFLVR